MIMASDKACEGTKDVRSVHTVFARAGTYTKPIELDVDSMHAGRTWASDTVTATQDGRLLSRSIILLNTVDEDLMRHEPEMPEGVPGFEDLESQQGQAFPGSEVRPVPGEQTLRGVPVEMAWLRFGQHLDSPAANQAVLAWATCGNIIGLGMRPHRSTVRIQDAHHTVSTGVIGHTLHYTERFDASAWLLMVTEAEKTGSGRVYGGGRCSPLTASSWPRFSRTRWPSWPTWRLTPSARCNLPGCSGPNAGGADRSTRVYSGKPDESS